VCYKANYVLAVTDYLKRILERKSLKNIMLVPNGADLTLFKSKDKLESRRLLGLNDDYFIIAYAGMIGSYHDISKLIILVKRLNEMGYKVMLLLAGPIMDKKHQILINSIKLKSVLTYLGELDTERLITALSAADVGIISLISSPLFNYAVPVKFYEYIALELPVLALCTRNCELWKIVKSNGLGFVCEPTDHTCIERSLKALMSKEEYLKIKSNVKRFRYHVDRAICAQKLLANVKHMLSAM